MKAPESPPVRVLVSPDKFKGTLTAVEAARAVVAGLTRAGLSRGGLPRAGRSQVEVRAVPVADGGEGTVDAVVGAGAQRRTTRVEGPLGAPVEAGWALLGEEAVVEAAAACGLQYVDPTPMTAVRAGTGGVGELVLAAVEAGARRIRVGIGGTASTDGGMGALRSLGVRFLDAAGQEVVGGGGVAGTVREVDMSGLDPRLRGVQVVLGCDVRAPMVGPDGAAAVFGPQKGADAAAVRVLDDGLRVLADALHRATGRDPQAAGWTGAGGALAAGLYAALDAEFESGLDLVAAATGLDEHLRWCDVVVVGEGRLDAQSLAGKAAVAVAARARRAGRPAVAVAGAVELDAATLAGAGILAARSAVETAGSTTAALADAAHWVEEAGAALLPELLTLARTRG